MADNKLSFLTAHNCTLYFTQYKYSCVCGNQQRLALLSTGKTSHTDCQHTDPLSADIPSRPESIWAVKQSERISFELLHLSFEYTNKLQSVS
jgi:hypothetical protein